MGFAPPASRLPLRFRCVHVETANASPNAAPSTELRPFLDRSSVRSEGLALRASAKAPPARPSSFCAMLTHVSEAFAAIARATG
eukprot:733074-Prymnesium_polylepis.1